MTSYGQPPPRPLPPSVGNTGYLSESDRYTDASSLGRADQEEQIQIHFHGGFDGNATHGQQTWETECNVDTQRAISKRTSPSFAHRVSRQKSRRRELMGRPSKPGITVDTSFTRHRGTEPHEVFPRDAGRGSGSVRKSPWFGLSRNSTKNKGLGITKGTPQPEHMHRKKQSIGRNEPDTAMSLTPSSKTWQDISPWDRRIPIGISVPTDSISDFSTLHANRRRAGSDATLVTPSIIITPAAVKSAWSPDTPFTESDYTPSIYSRYQSAFTNPNAPPVPALPAGLSQHPGIVSEKEVHGSAGHVRNDTLDSAGTAFEEEDDDDSRRKDRIMSTSTVFEEDETPLGERSTQNALAIDTSMVPTPRRSQGWWNVITTPFVATPKSSTWPDPSNNRERTPDVPTVPVQYGIQKAENFTPPPSQPDPSVVAVSGVPAETNSNKTTAHQTPPSPPRAVTSPLSTMSASPVVGTAAIGTVLMPRQIEEPRQVNVNIELQDRRSLADSQGARANYAPPTQQAQTSAPAPRMNIMTPSGTNGNGSSQSLPIFAPPPKFAQKSSHWSYDNVSQSSSQASSPDLKGRKKHRKVCDVSSIWAFGKKKKQNNHDTGKNKKKKRGICFWGCCCCLMFIVLLAIIIPVTVVLTKKGDDTTLTAPEPSEDIGSPWLNLTDYPPIPTGVLTIAQPEVVEEESGCVAPTTLWSCALPKEVQQSVEPNNPDQPNFKVEITFENGSAAELPMSQGVKKRTANAVSAGAFIRSLLQARAAPSPSPSPPSAEDMSFLGQTTDGNSAPFEGEDTGLFISMQDAIADPSRVMKRSDESDATNITAVIPPPMLASDGTAAPANLLPFPSAQPLRLYNRGKDDEHYGFYNYYDRSIFLKQINGTNRGGNPADTDGGSTKDAANLRCTYSQTRFLVQIWTRSKNSKPLLQKSASGDADVLTRPGTFPYPVTVTIDRHGGDPAKKNLYCYEMEDDGTIEDSESKKYFQFEDRAFGGNLINGTQGQGVVSGPIDGGTGGCRCQWQNWLG